MKSRINWSLDDIHTWNITSGCTKVSEGCKNCYSERLVSTRLRHLPQNQGVVRGDKSGSGHWTGLVRCCEDKLSEPLRRKKPTTYFVCSQSDLFHPGVPFEFIDRAFAVMALCQQHTFMVLTKRPERMREYLTDGGMFFCNPSPFFDEIEILVDSLDLLDVMYDKAHGAGIIGTHEVGCSGERDCHIKVPFLPNVWLGISVENQKAADERTPPLLACPASKRFLSCEPLIGDVDLLSTGALGCNCESDDRCSGGCQFYKHSIDKKGRIDLVIVGGESGPNARPMHPDWARSLRDQCADAGVSFYFKQHGEWREPLEGECYNTRDGRAGNPPAFIVESSGLVHCFKDERHVNPKVMIRVGKKAAGCLLDGREHNEVCWL